MENITNITQGCDFTIRIKARRVGFNDYYSVSFDEISNITVNLVKLPSQKSPLSYVIDQEGRLVISVPAEGLVCTSYGIELTGFYNNGNWRHQIAPAFEIIKSSENDNLLENQSENITIDFELTLGETYVSSRLFAKTVEELKNSIKQAGDVNDIQIDGQSIVDPNTKVANFHSEDFAQINEIQVNGQTVTPQNKSVNIPVPTTVEELTDSEDYAKKSELQEASEHLEEMIDEVTVYDINATVDANVGNPSVERTVQGNVVQFDFKNLKGEQGEKMKFSDLTPEERESLRGPDGQSAIWNPQTEDVSVLEQKLGNSTINMMSQKAITDGITIEGNVIDLTELDEFECWINNDNVWAVPVSQGYIKCVFLPVQPGQIIRVIATQAASSYVAFLKSNSHGTGDTPDYSDIESGRIRVANGSNYIAKVPYDTNYVYVLTRLNNDESYAPFEMRFMKSVNQAHNDILQMTSQQVEALQQADNALEIEIQDKTATVVEMDTIYNTSNGYILINAIIGSAASNHKWVEYINGNAQSTCIPVTPGMTIILKASVERGIFYAFLKSLPTSPIEGKTPAWARGYSQRDMVVANTEARMTAPEDAAFFVFMSKFENSPRTPQRIAYLSDLKGAIDRLNERLDAKQGEQVTPNTIEYHTASVRRNVLSSDTNTDPTRGTEIQSEMVESGWAVMWPDAYTQDGKPTQIIAMLHGASAIVNETVMGYPSGNSKTWWNAWRNKYLQAGFAVMDINGLGESTEDDDNSKHYGCPTAIETLDKAFEYLKQHYNVEDKLLIHGTSMGGALAQSYTKTYPEKVLAVGLFAPVCLMLSASVRATARIANLWGYTDYTESRADKYAKLIGFAPFAKCLAWKDNSLVEMTWENIMNWTEAGEVNDNTKEDLSDYMPIEKFPVPVRCWHGTTDTNVHISSSKFVIEAYRRAGSQATLRICDGKDHNICVGNTPYVVNEAIEFFKRYL